LLLSSSEDTEFGRERYEKSRTMADAAGYREGCYSIRETKARNPEAQFTPKRFRGSVIPCIYSVPNPYSTFQSDDFFRLRNLPSVESHIWGFSNE
jgi:hypothetical protein